MQTHTPLWSTLVNVVLLCLSLSGSLASDTTTVAAPVVNAVGAQLARRAAPNASEQCPASLIFGVSIQCSIEAIDERDIYPFTAEKDDRVKVRIQLMAGDLDPAIHIYGPTGVKICTAFTSGSITEISSCNLPASGDYTLVVDDTYRTNTGQYLVVAQRLNNAVNAQPLTFNQLLTGTLSLAAQFNSYTILARAGVQVKITMARQSGTFFPRLLLYGPDGLQNAVAFTSGTVAEMTYTLPRTGTYTILADDIYVSNTGSYIMSMACLNGQCDLSSLYVPLIVASR